MKFKIFCLLTFSLSMLIQSCGCETEKNTYIFLVRHADRADHKDSLSTEGEQRAEGLKQSLENSELDIIYSSKYQRTLNTADPIAKAIQKKTQIYDPSKLQNLVDEIKNEHKGERVLVVGHSNTTPQLINLIMKNTNYENLDENEFDKLFLIISNDCCQPELIEMAYGNPSPFKE